MNPQKTLMATLAVFALISGAGAAHAYGGPECLGAGFHDGDRQGHWRNWSGKDRDERRTARHEKLHKALKLSEAQEAAWKAFIADDAPQWQRPDREAFAALSTPERMEKMLELSQKRQEFMAQRLAALKTFYAQLTDEQKKTFDGFHRGGDKKRPRGDRKKSER
ncbi:MAG: Spy/CpxP family protein refolding chaperone [Zoogloeaceae bacterium]|nr:Spy/CpxP family protein refolding chaperone [Zoogloeaceae bacterium]